MKQFSSIILFICAFSFSVSAQTPCEQGYAGPYPCNHVDLLKYLPKSSIGYGNLNDNWGWTSPNTGHEYALIGRSTGTSFIDITDPVHPIYLGNLPTQTTSGLWRDVKVYKHYAYIVSESPGHGMQVFNLDKLDSVIDPPKAFTEDYWYNQFGHCHNLAIDTASGFAYALGTNTFNGGPHIIDLSNPAHPTFAGGYEADNYTHDCEVVVYHGPDQQYDGHQIVFACNEDHLAILDATDKSQVALLSSAVYAMVGYTHQCWLTKDQKYLLLGDEEDETTYGINTRTLIWNVEDLANPQFLGGYYFSNGAIDHNLYILNNACYEANYRSGLRILDITDIADTSLNEIAWFDVIPADDHATFSGSWNAYPFFKSGVIPVSSIYDGVFLVKPRLIDIPDVFESSCGSDTVSINVNTYIQLYGKTSVTFNNLPAGISVQGPDSISTPGGGTYLLSGLSGLSQGNYQLDVALSNQDTTLNYPRTLVASNGVPGMTQLQAPPNNASIATTYSFLSWQGNGADSYYLQVAHDPDFQNVVLQDTVQQSPYALQGLGLDSTYYWRIKGVNKCGEGNWSDSFVLNTSGTLGLHSAPELPKLKLYPNPAKNVVWVTGAQQRNAWTIFDLTGKEITSGFCNGVGEAVPIKLGDLNSGVYILKIAGAQPARIVVE